MSQFSKVSECECDSFYTLCCYANVKTETVNTQSDSHLHMNFMDTSVCRSEKNVLEGNVIPRNIMAYRKKPDLTHVRFTIIAIILNFS